MNTMVRLDHERIPILLLLLSILVISILRWNYSPPTQFLEGDDAAIATGLARLCTKSDIGPYYFHPPKIDQMAYQQFQQTQNEGGNAEPLVEPQVHPFYRYDSMTGVYFLGSLTCSWGTAATRLLFLCFLAGTFFPLFLTLFLYRLFRPLPLLFTPICYAFISLSPEQWVSGSAYINDKILAICFLSLALWLIVITTENKIRRYTLLGVAGISIGLSVLMRFDSILFFPSILILFLAQSVEFKRRYFIKQLLPAGYVFFISTITYLCIMWVMRASVFNAFLSGSNASPSLANWYLKLRIIFVAFGWGQVIIALIIAGLFFVSLAKHLQETKVKQKISPRSIFKETLDAINSCISLKSLAIVASFLLIEPIFLFSFPFSSTKYVLFSSALFTAVCLVISFRVWQRNPHHFSFNFTKRRSIYAFLLVALFLPPLSGFIELRHIHTSDGVRYMGGWFLHQAQPNADAVLAKRIITCISNSPDNYRTHVIVKTPSWVLEESIAYEAASRGWKNRIIPISAFILNPEEETKMHFTLNQYQFPGSQEFGVSVTSDYDVYTYGDALTAEVFRESFGSNFIFYEEMACAFP